MVKQIYDYLRGEKPKPVWKCLMFKNTTRPKAIFTLWILMYRKLATVDRLAKWGLTHDTACVLCTNMDESLDHMFLQCHYVGGSMGKSISMGWPPQQQSKDMDTVCALVYTTWEKEDYKSSIIQDDIS